MTEGIGLQLAFYAFAATTLGSAVLAATARRIVHSAFSLLATFFGVAGLYGVLGSDFMAVTQVIVYVGGILILLCFGVLLTDRVPDEYRVPTRRNYLLGGTAAALTAVVLVWAVAGTDWTRLPHLAAAPGAAEPTTRAIGRSLLTDYLLPFEFASILLLVVLVGAARVARGGTR
jgi:NADH:ubiquinone oxidoreductase subunit 6 (subunit J)